MVIVVEAVVALVLRGQLAVVGRDVVLEDAGVLVAVRLVEAGVEDVDGGVVALGLNAGHALAGGAGDDLDVHVGIERGEALGDGLEIQVGGGGADHEVAGDVDGLFPGTGTGAAARGGVAVAAGGQRQGHDQGERKREDLLFHRFSPSIISFLISVPKGR